MENSGQTTKAIETRKQLYSDETRVQEITNKTRQTIFKKSSVTHNIHEHIEEFALNILLDKEKFEAFLIKNGLVGSATLLGVWPTTISDYHKKYNLNILNSYANSSYEVECLAWLKSLGIFGNKDRTVCKPKELDIYIPSHNFAIEFDGLFWHSESMLFNRGKNKQYHLNKTKICITKNIRLVHIFEDEWTKNKEVCMDLLKRFLNIKNRKIMARKCIIKELSNKDCLIFLKTNHLQGFAIASVNL